MHTQTVEKYIGTSDVFSTLCSSADVRQALQKVRKLVDLQLGQDSPDLDDALLLSGAAANDFIPCLGSTQVKVNAINPVFRSNCELTVSKVRCNTEPLFVRHSRHAFHVVVWLVVEPPGAEIAHRGNEKRLRTSGSMGRFSIFIVISS